MSSTILLDSILKKKKEEYPSLSEDEFFELYCAEIVLQEFDLNIEEIETGLVYLSSSTPSWLR